MTDDIIVTSLGSDVRIRCRDTVLANRIARLYDACRRDVRSNARVALEIEVRLNDGSLYEVLANGERRWCGAERERALEWCVWLVNNFVNERATALVLHAATAVINGRAVLVTGPSGAGKSTLVAALALRGAAYMGDDTVTVDVGGRVCANPKPIAIDERACAALSQIDPSNGELCARHTLIAPRSIGRSMRAGAMARPSLIVRACYQPGARTTLTAISSADAAELLADQSFNFARLGGAALSAVAAISRRCRAFVLEFSDLADAVDTIVAGADLDISCTDDLPGSACDDLHVEFCGGEALIWNQAMEELHHLSPTATEIWRACFSDIDTDLFATAPGMVTDVRQCIEELGAKGLLPVVRARRWPPMAV